MWLQDAWAELGEQLARLRVEHDDAARLRAVLRDGHLQLRIGERLDAAIDAQMDRRAMLRRR